MDIKGRVTRAAERDGITLSDIARHLGIAASPLIQSLAKNNRSYKRLQEIADYLKVPAGWIRNGGEDPWGGLYPSRDPYDDPEDPDSEATNALYDDDRPPSETELIEQIEKEMAKFQRLLSISCRRYLDLADLCKNTKGSTIPVSDEAIAEMRDILKAVEDV